MRNNFVLFSIFLLFCLTIFEGFAQTPEWKDPNSLPPWLTDEEKLRIHDIGKSFISTPPPQGVVRSIAEFERMQGVLIRYPLGISLDLVAAMSQHVTIYTLVADQWALNQANNSFHAAGVNMANTVFLIAPTNSYWTRDYGPWFIAGEDEQISIVDFIYNRPRPLDDDIPGQVADFLDITRYGMNLIHTGGNYMADGYSSAASTDLVLEENVIGEQQLRQRMEDYTGVNNYHITIDPQNTYLKHIDTWGKFLDVDKILIAQVDPGHPQYTEHENVANYFSQQISAYGTPYQVYRVYTPGGQPYTNSLILNERVYVPVTGSAWDSQAIAVYQQAMPGYEVLGFTGSWQSTDALHCRVKGIADIGMLHISHIPLSGTYSYQPWFEIQADITTYSQADLFTDSLFIIYSKNGEGQDTVPLFHVTGNTYSGQIHAEAIDTLMNYYIYAADASGRRETFPFTAPAASRSFKINPPTVLNAKVFLEGPYNAEQNVMATHINQYGYIPLNQPYNVPPWNYPGHELVEAIPSDQIVDWVLISFRMADEASQADAGTTLSRKAGFLLADGRIVDIDGVSPITVDLQNGNDVFVVIHHRNHLDIISSVAVAINDGVITIDFTNSDTAAFSPSGASSQKALGNGKYGMFGGDADGNNQVQSQDKNDFWNPQSGGSGYHSADFDMDGQVQTQDKNNIWNSNSGLGSFVP